jgi:uncharacterized protein (TIGR02271 family)
MTKTIIAMYDEFDHAQDAVEDLVEAGFNRSDISIVARNTTEEGSTTGTMDTDEDAVTAGEGAGFGAVVGGLIGLGAMLIPGIGPVIAAGPLAALLGAGVGAAAGAATGGITAALVKTGVSEEEAGYYAEGIRRGGALVTVNARDEQADRASEILDRHNPVDIDERSSYYQQSGYSGYNESSQPYTSSQIQREREQYRTLNAGDQAKMEVIEEELQVGKRDVERGGVRVHSYVTETPVREDVNLREEHVHVDRQPVDRPATAADLNAFEEGVIEVTERAEEPVVQKTARVVEEVTVGKDVENRTETVEETVRRKDVDVENMGTGTASGMRTGTPMSWDSYANDFRTHYNSNYANSGYTFEQYTPAYRYGYTLASNDQFRDYDWNRIEPEARRNWEARNPNTWEQFKGAIHDAWDRVRGLQ